MSNTSPLRLKHYTRQVTAHPTVTTSVMVYCGAEVNDNGTVSLATTSLCLDESGSGILAELASLGVRSLGW